MGLGATWPAGVQTPGAGLGTASRSAARNRDSTSQIVTETGPERTNGAECLDAGPASGPDEDKAGTDGEETPGTWGKLLFPAK